MTDVKICGLTREEDVALACSLGARYLGFNFARGSPRRVAPEAAARLSAAVLGGKGVLSPLKVGVFVDESAEEIRCAIEAAALDLVQLHRPISPDDLAFTPRPVVAVAHVGFAGTDALVAPPDELLARCRALLFDTATASRPDERAGSGGTGRVFDWAVVASRRWPVPVFLAGGLTADNVAEAIALVRPAAVDVASGVESVPGIKDPERLARFFDTVREADDR